MWPVDWFENALTIVRAIYYLFAIAAIIIAGVWAWFRWRRLRESASSLSLDMKIEDLVVAKGKRYVLVLLEITNTSKVQVDFGHSECSLHRLENMKRDDINKIQCDIRGKKTGAMFPWPQVNSPDSVREKELDKGQCIIEPQAKEQQFYEFIIDDVSPIQILVKCYIYDRSTEGKDNPSVWAVHRIYRLGGESNNG